MKINKITCVFFSATGLTEKAAGVFLSALPLAAEKVDVTPFSARGVSHVFGPEELVVFAAPVYGGRIPAAAAERFARLTGNRTPAVLLAVFGNRDYDDALLEMNDLSRAGGFIPAASGACVQCGKCAAACPVNAIPQDAPDRTDKTRCISCMRCIAVCPVHARGLNKLVLALAEKVFCFKYGKRKEPEFFV